MHSTPQYDSDPNVFGQVLFEEWLTRLAMRRVFTDERATGRISGAVVSNPVHIRA